MHSASPGSPRHGRGRRAPNEGGRSRRLFGSLVVCARTIRSANGERAYPYSSRFDNHDGALLQRACDIW